MRPVGAAEEALERQGWTGERLVREARRITGDYERAHIPYLTQHRRDELVDFVVEAALRATITFDPERATTSYGRNGGRHFDSWICDVMTWRCTDWLRSKREGNGDARKGFANRIVLTGEFDDEPDVDLEIERYLSADRVAEWTEAAELVNLPLAEFVVVTLDRAATAIQAAVRGPAA
jgi:DNA-directed RNA polymerase specialized sigma24 family protein